MLPVGLCAQIACVWEATARKPGNVHRFADFADTTYLDLVLSAAAIAPVMEAAAGRPVGETVLAAVRATRQVTSANTNLGMVLLFAPLAAVPLGEPLRDGVRRILGGLTLDDSRAVFEAIRLANPGGLGEAPEQDVHGEPTLPLREVMALEVMALAANRDLIALQYVIDFAQVFDEGLPYLLGMQRQGLPMEDAIVAGFLFLLSRHPDSLIARKRGPAIAAEVSARAGKLLGGGKAELEEFDAWLRSDGHARNPGTTADLIAACLFVGLREGLLSVEAAFAGRGAAKPPAAR
jgi:triphosphoribosyl-dephospho-CoA synthase